VYNDVLALMLFYEPIKLKLTVIPALEQESIDVIRCHPELVSGSGFRVKHGMTTENRELRTEPPFVIQKMYN
jgi:hypothetical protein